jgi:hypothetical protein
MTEPLHVLVYGSLDDGACPVYRFGMHREALAGHGVELRGFTDYSVGVPEEALASPEAAFASRDLVLDRTAIDWADVIVFRRFYATLWTCRDCALVTGDGSEADRHAARVRHRIAPPDRLIRPLFTAFEQHPEVLRGRAVVYESDDDLLNVQTWNGVARRIAPEREIIERMVRRADLVTVTTPLLAERHRPYNDAVRVVRNAVEPAWYAVDGAAPAPPGDPRLLYYAKPNRMRDYEVCRPAVDALAASVPGVRRVWLGALDAPAGGSPAPVIAAVDEVGPFVEGPAAFAASLAAARPHIGLAPLVGDEFDQAKSELHWLEYSMAGAATVATRIPGGGPFDVIRDGVDGLLASTAADWLAHLRRLASSSALREELAGRARERVLAEYTVAARAAEWADAYRWAADHAGRALAGRVHALGALDGVALVREARASREHRQRSREAAEAAPGRLAALRGERAACWPPADASDRLVSVLVPVLDEPLPLVRRAVRAVLASSHTHLEVLLAAPAGPGSDRLAPVAASDPRVRVLPVPLAALPGNPELASRAGTGAVLAAALAAARGSWIAPMGPEGEVDSDAIGTLLAVAVEHELELVYGQARFEAPDGSDLLVGAWPPHPDRVLTTGTELFSARLRDVATYDPDAWRDAETSGWALWRTLLEAGVRVAGIEVPVVRLTLLTAEGAEPADAVLVP